MTMKHLRRVPFDNAHNFRDLGGYATADGKMTKWNLIYRTDGLADLSDNDWEKMKKLNVDLLIDLRSDKEREKAPVVPAYELKYCPFSLMKDLDNPFVADKNHSNTQDSKTENSDSAVLSSMILKSMSFDYRDTLYGNIGCMSEILNTILEDLASGNGSTAFFCSAGKDRTGITASLILWLCGVSREDIIADYMVSNTYNTNGINKSLDSMPKEILDLIPNKEAAQVCFASDPEMIIPLIDSFEERDIRQCLADNGFGRDKQEKLVDLMTE